MNAIVLSLIHKHLPQELSIIVIEFIPLCQHNCTKPVYFIIGNCFEIVKCKDNKTIHTRCDCCKLDCKCCIAYNEKYDYTDKIEVFCQQCTNFCRDCGEYYCKSCVLKCSQCQRTSCNICNCSCF